MSFTAADRTPFTYVVECTPTGKRYYGVRFAKGCQPSDLWTCYFTSCAAVQKDVALYGREAFSHSVRKIFSSVEAARRWETRVLVKLGIPGNLRWYNKTSNIAIESQAGVVRSSATRLKMSLSKQGANNPWFGKRGPRYGLKLSAETKLKIANALLGKPTGPCSDVRRARISEAKVGKQRPPFSLEWRRNLATSHSGNRHWNFGQHWSEATRLKVARANSVRVTCDVCGLVGGIRAMRRYHFNNCKLKNVKVKV